MTPDGFLVGLHQTSDLWRFEQCMVSVNRFRGPKGRKAAFPPLGAVMPKGRGVCRLKRAWLDSAAFTEVVGHGGYRHSAAEFAAEIVSISALFGGRLEFVSAQDYMCEAIALKATGLTLQDHQDMTIARYRELVAALAQLAPDNAPTVVPVLQGWTPEDYVRCLRAYGDLLKPGAHVGVGSICKRNSDPAAVLAILRAIKAERPDLKLHAFGLKLTALSNPEILALIETADSMAWSYHARKNGKSANDWTGARDFVAKIRERIAA